MGFLEYTTGCNEATWRLWAWCMHIIGPGMLVINYMIPFPLKFWSIVFAWSGAYVFSPVFVSGVHLLSIVIDRVQCWYKNKKQF